MDENKADGNTFWVWLECAFFAMKTNVLKLPPHCRMAVGLPLKAHSLSAIQPQAWKNEPLKGKLWELKYYFSWLCLNWEESYLTVTSWMKSAIFFDLVQ